MRAYAYIAVPCVAATAYLIHAQGTVVYRGDGWCLSYQRDEVTLATDNPAANQIVPYFLVPSDVPTSNILDEPDALGWTVRYTNNRRSTFLRDTDESCGAPDSGTGLVRFPPRTHGDNSPPANCPGLSSTELLLPEASDPLATHVRITCAVETRVPNCGMVDVMPNGWQAEISVPRPHIARWRDASADARAFFDAKLTDCLPNG